LTIKKLFQFYNEKIQFDNEKKTISIFLQFEIGWAIFGSVPVQNGCSDASTGLESGWQQLVGD